MSVLLWCSASCGGQGPVPWPDVRSTIFSASKTIKERMNSDHNSDAPRELGDFYELAARLGGRCLGLLARFGCRVWCAADPERRCAMQHWLSDYS
jgi:hypothetical protein